MCNTKEEIYQKVFNVKEKVIAIIGATGLLGTQYVNFLSSLGAIVIIGDVDDKKCKLLEDQVKQKYNANCLSKSVDNTDEKSLNEYFENCIKVFGKLDVLINNAQIKPEGFYASFENYSKETLIKVIDGNLIGVIIACQHACRQFVKQGYGNIINVSSLYGLLGADQRLYDEVKNIYFSDEKFSSPVSYAVSKAGIINLTRYLASYYRERGIRVNCLTPGGVFDNHDDNFVKNYSSRTLLGRMGEKNEYNGAILFLASDASSYMTGANLIIDGGWSAI